MRVSLSDHQLCTLVLESGTSINCVRRAYRGDLEGLGLASYARIFTAAQRLNYEPPPSIEARIIARSTR